MPKSLGRVVTLPFMLATVVLLGLTVWVSWYISARNFDLTDTISEDVRSVQAAQELALGVREIRTHLNRFLLTREQEHLDAVPGLEAQTAEWLNRSEQTIRTPAGHKVVERIRSGYRQFQVEFPAAHRLQGDEQWQAIHRIKDDIFNAVIIESSNEFLHQKQELVADTVESNRIFAQRMSLALLALGASGAALGAVVGYMLSTSLRRTVIQLSLPIRNAAGKLSEVIGPMTVGSAQDFDEVRSHLDRITEQVGVVVERLQQQQREALRAEQLAAVGQMAAGMAHELRNPLTSVKILVQAARERKSLGPRDLLVLEQEVARLEQLIHSFLEFARPPRPEKQALDLRDTVRHTIDLFRPRAERAGLSLHATLPDEPVQVLGDATQLRQVLLNLLINAQDACARGGSIRVELEATPASRAVGNEDGWGDALLRVSDDGCGLPPELGERIFEPFVSGKPTGIGMGLSICRRIVEDHGGAIEVASRSPRGTEFTVRLPCGTPAAGPALV